MKNKHANHKLIAQKLGLSIAEHRKMAGLTQAKLAEKIEIEPVTLSRFETGATLPSLARLQDIADVLGLSLSVLIDSTNLSARSQSTELEKHMSGLSLQDRAMLVDWIKTLSKRLVQLK